MVIGSRVLVGGVEVCEVVFAVDWKGRVEG